MGTLSPAYNIIQLFRTKDGQNLQTSENLKQKFWVVMFKNRFELQLEALKNGDV